MLPISVLFYFFRIVNRSFAFVVAYWFLHINVFSLFSFLHQLASFLSTMCVYDVLGRVLVYFFLFSTPQSVITKRLQCIISYRPTSSSSL